MKYNTVILKITIHILSIHMAYAKQKDTKHPSMYEENR